MGHKHASSPTQDPARPDDADDGGGGRFVMPDGYRAHYGLPIARKATVPLRPPGDPEEAFADATRGSGGAVPFRDEMERSFGHDFSGVQAHLGQGGPLAGLQAEAATQGEQVAFGTDAPSRELVAHELAHVVQGRNGGGGGVHKKSVTAPGDACEHEADRAAAEAARGERVIITGGAPGGLARKGFCTLTNGALYKFETKDRIKIEIGDADLVHIEGEVDLEGLKQMGPDELVTVKSTRGEPQIFKVPVKQLYLDGYKPEKGERNGKDSELSQWDHKGDEDAPVEAPVKHPTRGNSEFRNLRIEHATESDLYVSLQLITVRSDDRFEWQCRLKAPDGSTTLIDLRDQWDNPGWDPEVCKDGKLIHPLRLPKQGRGTTGYDRTLYFKLPVAFMRKFFESSGGFTDSSIVQFGMRLCYSRDTPGPTCETRDLFKEAYPKEATNPQEHTWGFLRRPESFDGLLELGPAREPLKLPEGKRLTPKEYWDDRVGEEPPPFVSDFFPDWYSTENKLIQPLIPEKGRQPSSQTGHTEKHQKSQGLLSKMGAFTKEEAPQEKGAWSRLGQKKIKPQTLKLESRIESEATLAVSSAEKLNQLIVHLHRLCFDPTRLRQVLKAIDIIDPESWHMEPLQKDLYLTGPNQLYQGKGDDEKKSNAPDYQVDDRMMQLAGQMFGGGEVALVQHDPAFLDYLIKNPIGVVDTFNDMYLDDKDHSMLRKGVGVRVRQSSKITKLCIKTGAGYQVHHLDQSGREKQGKGTESDIWRRYELGFELRQGATPQEIGLFLGSGTQMLKKGQRDPWNMGGEQAEQAVGHEVDWNSLQEVMLLQGRRHKFELHGTRKGGGGALNVEISCDQTLGKLPDQKGKKTDFYKDKVPQTWNVEMEMEHLAPGAQTPQQDDRRNEKEEDTGRKGPELEPSSSPSVQKEDHGSKEEQDDRQVLLPPVGFPTSRLYRHSDLGEDDKEKFITESFRAFYELQNLLVGLMRQLLNDKGGGELQGDVQKVEKLYKEFQK